MMQGKRDDVQEFDRCSGTYERSWAQPIFFDRVHRVVLDLVASEGRASGPESILDVGCGTGRLLRRAGARWPAARLIGVDPAEGMVEVARRLTPAATFLVGTAEALPVPDSSVDAVLSTLSFHHWRDQAAGVRDIARVLRPGGCFFLGDVLMPGVLAKIIRHFGSTGGWREIFAQAGLQVQAQQWVFRHFVLVMAGKKA